MSALSSASKFSPYGLAILPCRSEFYVCYRLDHPRGMESSVFIIGVCSTDSVGQAFTCTMQIWVMWTLVHAMQNS
ncbi:hypothetical protein CY34DRAFT_801776 [Suillus luteus UH-Slu-Lm8-n1]|uniref:Uncharacterized protein n=1 Tax=Suillus luteus UH-Slu-Lm8-n1 TaxID=930992 RepID=A0A0D0BQ98_9AGAM|nr:hypothetical protein CY34DRAFT_801776 [Suillus luteus UH-Slu-Lm8-n1]